MQCLWRTPSLKSIQNDRPYPNENDNDKQPWRPLLANGQITWAFIRLWSTNGKHRIPGIVFFLDLFFVHGGSVGLDVIRGDIIRAVGCALRATPTVNVNRPYGAIVVTPLRGVSILMMPLGSRLLHLGMHFFSFYFIWRMVIHNCALRIAHCELKQFRIPNSAFRIKHASSHYCSKTRQSLRGQIRFRRPQSHPDRTGKSRPHRPQWLRQIDIPQDFSGPGILR